MKEHKFERPIRALYKFLASLWAISVPSPMRNPVSGWFELSYAQFLTVPRLVMESMPIEWRRKMVQLIQEMDDTFDWRPEGQYWVRLRDKQGRFCEAPLADYRHGNIEHLRRK